MNHWRTTAKVMLSITLAVLLAFNPISDDASAARTKDRAPRSEQTSAKLSGKISEVSPPTVIQELQQELDKYQPQVAILSPKPNQVLSDTTVAVRFQVKDLPIFKDEKLGLGPHLHVFLDNKPYQAVYDTNKPFVLEDLEPGTHTLRVFASRPWHESFKNEGAYTQLTFHVFTKTQDSAPNSDLPLLTYSRPQGSYGAEPIMLDFYLTNAPLHLIAQESAKDDIADWRIRCTINGDSFILDRWQAIYLKGFKPGQNWVQLEFLDDKGNPVQNIFNNTARLLTYEPNGKDTLSKLVRGELSAAEARGIVDPNYKPVEAIAPTPAPSPTVSPTPEIAPIPSPEPLDSVDVTQPEVKEPPTQEPTTPSTEEATESKPNFFSRLRSSFSGSDPSSADGKEPTQPSGLTSPEPTPEVESVQSEPGEATEKPADNQVEPTLSPKPTVDQPPALIQEKPQEQPGVLDRFRSLTGRKARSQPSPSPTIEARPTAIPTPVTKPSTAIAPEPDQREESNPAEATSTKIKELPEPAAVRQPPTAAS